MSNLKRIFMIGEKRKLISQVKIEKKSYSKDDYFIYIFKK